MKEVKVKLQMLSNSLRMDENQLVNENYVENSENSGDEDD